MGDPDKAETPGGAEAFVKDAVVPTFDTESGDDTHGGCEITTESLTGEVISAC